MTVTKQCFRFVLFVATAGGVLALSADGAVNRRIRASDPSPQGATASTATRQAEASQPIALRSTTADLKQDYEVVGIVTHYQEMGFGFRGDPLEGALKAGWPRFEERARSIGADAIVGVRFEFENPGDGGKQEGRLLIYGTAVKVK